MLKILIFAFSLFLVLNMIFYFFPEINFNNLLGLLSNVIAAMFLLNDFSKTMMMFIKA